ncbi:GIY-YIG nuclease family protein [Streptomyces sp. NPDC014894]|uniref:GIY-YIG nuclease family protein n=1 Tax=Streptomyces sp. NPDC014894 TaxID=3364931 RepID=UPI0036FEFFC8
MAAHSVPKRFALAAPQVQDFRKLLTQAMSEKDPQGRTWADARWGCYAFYDYDGEPIYVGQTNEKLRTRIGRHLTNQRSDAVAMRILDIFEVAEMELWPLWDLQDTPKKDEAAREQLDTLEYSAYLHAIDGSRFNAILNEKIPPLSEPAALPPSRRFKLISDATRRERGHPDVRIARRAETLSRLTAVAHERGVVSAGLRRVIVIQAVRLAHLAASRFAHAQGLPAPSADAISIEALVGTVLQEHAGSQSAVDDPDAEGSDSDTD